MSEGGAPRIDAPTAIRKSCREIRENLSRMAEEERHLRAELVRVKRDAYDKGYADGFAECARIMSAGGKVEK